MGTFVIYGATGYTGRLVAARACEAGLAPVLAGRNATALAALAGSLGLPHRVASLTDTEALDEAFRGATVVLNVAGPFSHSADAVADACRNVGAHYLDVSGEPTAVARLAERHREARRLGVAVVPAVGFNAVATDGLAVHVARRLPGARHLALAVTPPRALSSGSLRTLLEHAGAGLARRAGALVPLALGSESRSVDFGGGPARAVSVGLVDVVTAFHSTGIPNITTYVEATGVVQAALAGARLWSTLAPPAVLRVWAEACGPALDGGRLVRLPDGRRRGACVVAVAEDGRGQRATARLHALEPYEFTAQATVAVVHRVLAGDIEPGFQLPGRLYGPDFVLQLPGVTREDLA
jgi:short subunit dehydrogenase-like uncharacterized protein